MKHPEIIRLDDGKLVSNRNHLIEVAIPFDGFYESFLSNDIDTAVECLFEDDSSVDYAAIRQKLAEKWADRFNVYVTEEMQIPCAVTLKELVSPKEYNFASDQLFVNMPLITLQNLFDYAGVQAIGEHFVKVFTDRSGFTSFYSTQMPDYDLDQWDQPLLGEVIRAAMIKFDPDHIFQIYQQLEDDIGEVVLNNTMEK